VSLVQNVTFSKDKEELYFRIHSLAKRSDQTFSRVVCALLSRGLQSLEEEAKQSAYDTEHSKDMRGHARKNG